MKNILPFFTILAIAVTIPSVSASTRASVFTPYSESFANQTYSGPEWEVIKLSGELPTVHLVNYEPNTGLYAASVRDKGFLVVENDHAGEVILATPAITVTEGMGDALFEWFYFRNSNITLQGVSQWNDEKWEPDYDLNDWGSDDMAPGWTSISVSGWPKYGTRTGQTGRFGWKLILDGSGGVFCIDQVSFKLTPKYDFGLLRPYISPSPQPGHEMTVAVEVGAFGQLTSTNYKVTAQLDGVQIWESTSPDRGPWGTRYDHQEFQYTLPEGITLGQHTMTFNLEFAGDYASSEDGNLENNTIEVPFNVTCGFLQPATKLEKSEEGILTWNIPASGHRFTDDFEYLESFSDGNLYVAYDLHPIYDYDVYIQSYDNHGTLGLYSVIDADGKPTIAAPEWEEALVPNLYHLMACTVADFTLTTESMRAASGNKTLLFWGNADGSPADNWLITPELSGEAQQVTLKMAAADPDSPEKIEILVSTSDKDISSFSRVSTIDIESTDYEDYHLNVPENVRYLALRHISDEGYALLIDDLEYAMKSRDVIGSNIYKDGMKVNDEPIQGTTFAPTEHGNYSVTVVYPEGESAPTPEVEFKGSGISNLSGENYTKIFYLDLFGNRIENPSEGIFIRIANGKATKVIF